MDGEPLITVTLNPSIDHSVTVQSWLKDRTNRPVEFWRDPGGKGINVSRVIRRLGGSTVAFGLVGGVIGQLLRQALDQETVPYNFTTVQGETRINTIITDRADGTQTRLNLPGPEVQPGELNELCRRLDSVPDPACLLLGGSLPIGTPCEIYERLTASFKARGVRVFLDADGDPLRCGIRAKPYLIKPNEFEVADLVGERLRALEEYVEAAEKLAGQVAEVVVISLGEQGAIAANGKRVLRVRSPHVEPRSAVGAGDSMLGAMALALSRGDSLENALCWGAAAGAAAVITPGTELCRPEDVRRLLPQVQVEELTRK